MAPKPHENMEISRNRVFPAGEANSGLYKNMEVSGNKEASGPDRAVRQTEPERPEQKRRFAADFAKDERMYSCSLSRQIGNDALGR